MRRVRQACLGRWAAAALLTLSSTASWVVPGTLACAQDAAPRDARDAEARGLFEAGRAAFVDGRFEDALRYFQQSYNLSQRPELLYNVGSAADRLQREREALQAFERYLVELPDAPNRREVEGRVRVLREHLARQEAAEAGRAHRDTSATPPPSSPPVPPEEDGAVAPVVDPLMQQREGTARGGDAGVAGEWWFWTLIGATVAGAVIAAVLVGTSQETTYPPYRVGDDGALAVTLSVPVP